MDIRPKSVLVYRTRDGGLPFDDWLREVRDANAVAREQTQERDIRQAQQYWRDYQQRESK